MNCALRSAVESAIETSTGSTAQWVQSQSSQGGCINRSEVITLLDGRRFFVKTNDHCPLDMFECESAGLEAMRRTQTVKVPQVICHGTASKTVFLVLKVVETGKKSKGFFEDLGRQLAEMHRVESGSDLKFGFSSNNYIGSTEQKNSWTNDWVEFWRKQRLGFQFQLAKENGFADSTFERLAAGMLGRMEILIETDEPPSLIHGDLWSGNYLVDRAGEPVLIDPAVYFGHREAEFGMTTLFGGFGEKFYAAYNESWPLADGAQQRIEIYRLYHLLNHLNLFGVSYRSGCLEIMKKYG